MEKSEFRILVVDDVESVRGEIEDILAKQGYQVSGVGSVRELFHVLQGPPFDVIFLDILLERDLTIEATAALFRKLFQGVEFSDEEVLEDFALTPQQVVNGRYILPLVKAICPDTRVIMLSNAVGSMSEIEDIRYLEKHGAYLTVHKYSSDPHFSIDRANLISLDREIAPYLEELFNNAAEGGAGGIA